MLQNAKYFYPLFLILYLMSSGRLLNFSFITRSIFVGRASHGIEWAFHRALGYQHGFCNANRRTSSAWLSFSILSLASSRLQSLLGLGCRRNLPRWCQTLAYRPRPNCLGIGALHRVWPCHLHSVSLTHSCWWPFYHGHYPQVRHHVLWRLTSSALNPHHRNAHTSMDRRV